MPRQTGTVVQNNFVKGLITEFTGLNFPEDAATDALNVRFTRTGALKRRLGIDLEDEAVALTYSLSDGVIKEFVWHAVAKNGGFTFLVLQKGSVVHFFELDDADNLSLGIHPTSLDLNDFRVPGAPTPENTPCSFASGAGYLFIAHPNCNPIIVRWENEETDFQRAQINIRIRDFEGVEDSLKITENPATLTDAHHYNLKNQGWDQQVRVGNVTNEIGEGGSNSPGSNSELFWSNI